MRIVEDDTYEIADGENKEMESEPFENQNQKEESERSPSPIKSHEVINLSDDESPPIPDKGDIPITCPGCLKGVQGHTSKLGCILYDINHPASVAFGRRYCPFQEAEAESLYKKIQRKLPTADDILEQEIKDESTLDKDDSNASMSDEEEKVDEETIPNLFNKKKRKKNKKQDPVSEVSHETMSDAEEKVIPNLTKKRRKRKTVPETSQDSPQSPEKETTEEDEVPQSPPLDEYIPPEPVVGATSSNTASVENSATSGSSGSGGVGTKRKSLFIELSDEDDDVPPSLETSAVDDDPFAEPAPKKPKYKPFAQSFQGVPPPVQPRFPAASSSKPKVRIGQFAGSGAFGKGTHFFQKNLRFQFLS